jgi:probable F420-dependent oxidoreductase
VIVKIGLTFFPISPKSLFPAARRADELGYESLWLGEHVVIPAQVDSRHPYAPELGPPLPGTPLLDPLIVFGYLAASTQRIKLGTSIYLTALRHPIVAARLIASAHLLSGGRVILGSGVGWIKEEFDAVGVPWEHRGGRMEEAIQVMRRLWREPQVEHRGRFYQFDAVGFEPKPPGGSVPILIGGESPAALKRAARIGDGWLGVFYSPEVAAAKVRELRSQRESDSPFEITVSSETLPTVDSIRRYRDAGVDRLMFMARALSGGQKTPEAMLTGMERFASEVMSRLDS